MFIVNKKIMFDVTQSRLQRSHFVENKIKSDTQPENLKSTLASILAMHS